MAVNFMQNCTAGSDLEQGLRRIYEGKKYRHGETEELYEFVSFLSSVPGEVLVRNITRDITEQLSSNQWFSFRRVPEL